jgi:hypothetical protein
MAFIWERSIRLTFHKIENRVAGCFIVEPLRIAPMFLASPKRRSKIVSPDCA